MSELLNYPTDTMQAATPQVDHVDDGEYYDVTRLKRQYYDFLGAKDAEIKEARESRLYYHGSQWTSAEIEVLKLRKQPVITKNRIERKINAIVGLVERLRQDPKAYARTPQHEQGAELATAVMRYVLDSNDWKSKSSRIARLGAVDGVAGLEYDLQKGDQGDPDLGLHIVYGDTFFYDARSFDEGFTDVRYNGVAKWVDVEQAKELVPEKADEIDGLIETGSDMATAADADRERTWINTNEKRVRLIDHWYIKDGVWKWALYISNTVLMEGVSPFVDEKGKTFSRYRMFSCNVDQDGDRYGFIRNMKSSQDEINHRSSKALHNLHSRRLILTPGAVNDVEVTRREWAKSDGIIEVNPGGEVKPDDRTFDFKGELELLQLSMNEIENFGPNPALIGQGLEGSSGRAINLLQQAGMAELGPYLSAYKNWKMRVYRDIWNIIQQHWKAERWIRVTDDMSVPQFFKVNEMKTDELGRPMMVNSLGSLDVDLIVDEGPDAVNMQADNYMALQSLGPTFAQNFPEVALELVPLSNSVKKPMLDKIRQKQSQPPPPDPKVQALQAQAQIDAQRAQQEMQIKQQEAQLEAQRAREESQFRAMEAQQARVQKQEEFDFNMMLKSREAEAEMLIERQKANNSMTIEGMKAANTMRIATERSQQTPEAVQ